MKQRALLRLVAAATLLASSAHAPAALVDRGGGMIYDSDQNITWLADWGAAGVLTWQQAISWADGLVHGSYSDWRLPAVSMPDADCSDAGCTGNEMGYLFYHLLGGHTGESVLDPTGDTAQELAHRALFQNVQGGEHWTGTVYAADPDLAWRFEMSGGYPGAANVVVFSPTGRALAVRDGDVAGTPGHAVPEPASWWLAALGLALAAGAPCGRKRGARSAAATDQAAL